MRPLELTVEGFGSYAQKNTVDFDRDDLRLFLVAGDTGAGKSTLFEAIVFALYGSTNSEQKVKKARDASGNYVDMESALCSHYGGGDCSVTLRFSMGSGSAEEIYSVTRSPRRPPRKGNKNPRPQSVKLELPDGRVITGWEEANKKLLDIVKLDKSQFMQIGMLAQGQFMKLLTARSEDKRRIFRQLFGTDLFSRIQAELSQEASTGRAEMDAWWNRVKGLASSIALPEAAQEEPREMTEVRTLLAGLSAEKTVNVVLAERLSEGLAQLAAQAQKTKTSLDAAAADAAQKAKDAADARRSAEQLNELFEQAANAQKALEALQVQKAEADGYAVLAEKLRSAFRLSALFAAAAKAEKDKTGAEERIRSVEDKLPGIKNDAAAARQRAKDTDAQYQKIYGAHTALAAEVNAALDQFEQIDTLNKQIRRDEKQLKKHRAGHAQAIIDLKTLKAEVDAWEAELRDLSDIDVRLERRQNDQKTVAEAENLLSQATKAIRKLNSARAKYQKTHDAYEQEYDALNEARAALFGDYAGVLAEELVDGKPCPVCGSTSHPDPHKADRSAASRTREEIEDQEKRVVALRKDSEKASNTVATAEAEYDGAAAYLQDKLNAVRTVAAQSGIVLQEDEKSSSLIKRMSAFVGADLVRLKKSREHAAELRKSLDGAEQKEDDLTKALHEAERHIGSLETAVKTARASVSSLLARLRFASSKEAEAEYKKSDAVLRDAQAQKDAAAEAAQIQDSTAARTEANLAALREQLPGLSQTAQDTRSAYDTAMQKENLPENEWRDLAEAHEEKDVKAYEDRSAQFNQSLHTAEGAAKAAADKISGRTAVEVAPLCTLEREADAASAAAQSAAAEAAAQLTRYQRAQRELTRSLKEHKEQAAVQARLERLDRRLNGTSQQQRVPLETYVQRAYFENVLDAANDRFSDMTGGQYELQLVDLDQAGLGRGRDGLELMVYSHATGQVREISTLSGGESFMAALSLALGMADTIEQRSAAVSLDMMFVDEGFGSLDDNARREAVRILQQLTDGSKLIGIISHVSELKKEIDDQLLVTKDNTGSHVAWK